MSDIIDVPTPSSKAITSEKRLTIVAKICAVALYACSDQPLTDIELESFYQQLKVQMDAISEDPRIKG